MLACRRRGRARHARGVGHDALLADAAALHHPRARGGAVRALHVVRDRLRSRSRHSAWPSRCILYYVAPKPWFPTDHSASGDFALPGVWDLFVFLVIVVAMFWRGASLPGRGELIEKRLPFAPRSDHLLRNALIGAGVCAAALTVLPWNWRQALIVSLLASLVCLSYVVITGFVGQISVVQIALAGVAGYAVSKTGDELRRAVPARADHRRGLRDGARPARGGVGAPRARRQPRGRHARCGGRDREVRVRQLPLGRRVGRGAGAAAEGRRPGTSGRTRHGAGSTARYRARSSASSCSSCIVGLCLLMANVRRSSLGRQMLAVRSNERAAAAAGVDVTVDQAHGLRAGGVHRRHRRSHVRLRVRRRRGDEVRRVRRAWA